MVKISRAANQPFDRDLMRDALKFWHSLPELGKHPLAQLKLVEEKRRALNYPDTLEDRGRALGHVLRDAIRALGPENEPLPNDEQSPQSLQKRWRSYVILTYQYIEGRDPDYVAAQLSIALRTYYTEQARALDNLADVLQQREEALSGSSDMDYDRASKLDVKENIKSSAKPQTKPKRVTWIVNVVTLTIIFSSFVGGIIYLTQGKESPARREVPQATIISLTAEVQVRRKGTDRLRSAEFGMPLYRGDAISTYNAARATIICANGLLLDLPQRYNLTIDCEATKDAPVIGQLNPTLNQLIRNTEIFTDTITLNKARISQVRPEKTPLLLSPRNTVITDTRPTFRWQPVQGATGYQFSLISPGGPIWNRQTSATSLSYPADEPPLAPGSANIIVLKTLNDEIDADETVLQVLSQANLDVLSKAEAAIQNQPVDVMAKGYLLAQLYSQQGMWATAINELKQLTKTQAVTSAYLLQQLGDFYSEIELFSQAEENYQAALAAAEASSDQVSQARAYLGLARTAYALGHIEPALDRLKSAESLFHQIGEKERAERVAAERARLEN